MSDSISSTWVQLATFDEREKQLKRHEQLEPSLYQHSANLEWKATTLSNFSKGSYVDRNSYYQVLSRSPDTIDNLLVSTKALSDIVSIELGILDNEKGFSDAKDVDLLSKMFEHYLPTKTVIEHLDRQSLDILQTMFRRLKKYEHTMIVPFSIFGSGLPIRIVSIPYKTLYVKIEFKESVPSDIAMIQQATVVSGVARAMMGKTPRQEFIDSFVPIATREIMNSEEHIIIVAGELSLKALFVSVYDTRNECFVYQNVEDLRLVSAERDTTLFRDNVNDKARIADPLLHGMTPSSHFLFSFTSEVPLSSNGRAYRSNGHFNITKCPLQFKIRLNNPNNDRYQVSVCALACRCINYSGGTLSVKW